MGAINHSSYNSVEIWSHSSTSICSFIITIPHMQSPQLSQQMLPYTPVRCN
jgi:hypothetical protein